MSEREKLLEAALRDVLREFVPSKDRLRGDEQRMAFAAAQAALRSAKEESATLDTLEALRGALGPLRYMAGMSVENEETYNRALRAVAIAEA